MTEQQTSQPDGGTVLIVDDTSINLKLLSSMVVALGLKARPVTCAKTALQAASFARPELILLDIGMPEMNGFEACKALRRLPGMEQIPIILMGTLTQTEDRINAFRVGASDYVTKPFLMEELEARIQLHLDRVHMRRELQLKSFATEQLVTNRTKELDSAYKVLRQLDRMKREFLLLLAHELRTPSNGLFGVCELILEQAGDDPETSELKESFEISRERLLQLLEDSQYLLSLDDAGTDAAEKACTVDNFVKMLAVHLPLLSKALNFPTNSLIPATEAELRQLILQLAKLRSRILREEEKLPLVLQSHKQALELSLSLPKLNLRQADCDSFFDLTSMARSQGFGDGLGLGPIIAKRILERCGGSIILLTINEIDATLVVTLPVC